MYNLPEEMWVVREDQDTGEKFIIVQCPNCAHWSYLDHDINDKGEINPSVICTWDECNFHENITLQNWDPELMEL